MLLYLLVLLYEPSNIISIVITIVSIVISIIIIIINVQCIFHTLYSDLILEDYVLNEILSLLLNRAL